MVPSLVAIAGPLRGQTVSLTEESLTIGREPSNRLHPPDLSLSRSHSVLVSDHDGVTLTDLDSVNGTFVNGVPIKTRVLEHGDQIKVGESVFLFVAHENAASDASDIELDDRMRHSTAQLRKEDMLYLYSDQMADAFPPTPRRARDLNILLRVSATLGSLRTSDDLQRTLIELLFEAVPADRAAILLSENDGADFASVYARGRHVDAPVQISRSVVRQVMTQGVGLLSNEAANADAFRPSESLIVTATRSVLCAPLKVSDRLRGALYVASSDASIRLDEDHLQLVMGLAGLAGLAFQNVHHIERLEQEARELRADLTLEHSMVGESGPMRQIQQRIAKAAPTDSTVLILGESGTGKELAARAIHLNSPRARRPFIAINAAAIAETLLESELFGYEKGAFTGAVAQKKGHLESANGGTVFLDEIGDLTPAMQVKLLRVLQEREFTRVGGTHPIRIDVRFIAATNKDLEAAVKDGRFREDLYYRLNVVVLRMPALRERRDDIPLLASFFLNRISARCKRRVVGLSQDARTCLMRHDWPGNVRELENAIERAVVLGSAERVQLDDLPETVLEHGSPGPELSTEYHHAVQRAKQQIVIAALARAEGSRAEAARQLGLHPNNLHRLIRNLNVKDTLKT
jgi:transcriptional regulator with GAF, ATPase, and Fis domain